LARLQGSELDGRDFSGWGGVKQRPNRGFESFIMEDRNRLSGERHGPIQDHGTLDGKHGSQDMDGHLIVENEDKNMPSEFDVSASSAWHAWMVLTLCAHVSFDLPDCHFDLVIEKLSFHPSKFGTVE
jgi:hypothetical protein